MTALGILWPRQAPVSARRTASPLPAAYDRWLVLVLAVLLSLGLLMVGSASISIAERQTGDPFYYLWHQGIYVGLGLLGGMVVLQLPLTLWRRLGPTLLAVAGVLLVVVLIPGLGRTVNGATRWLPLGIFNLQVSEFAKLALVVYASGYLVRQAEAVRTTVTGFLKPMGVLAGLAVLLLLEPDFGAVVVMGATLMGMLFLAGVRLWLFVLLAAGAVGALAMLAITSPYRMERLTTFLDPWADPFNSGFQLTQALIAFGRGEWFGVGLGASVQKLFYLPEAHTDFLFAVLAEELGLIGGATVILLFAFVVWRGLRIGQAAAQAGEPFGAQLAYGITLWLGLQAFVNMGVNMGALPTKGLTLPLMSYGGSSIVITCMALALLLRVDMEVRRRPEGRE